MKKTEADKELYWYDQKKFLIVFQFSESSTHYRNKENEHTHTNKHIYSFNLCQTIFIHL